MIAVELLSKCYVHHLQDDTSVASRMTVHVQVTVTDELIGVSAKRRYKKHQPFLKTIAMKWRATNSAWSDVQHNVSLKQQNNSQPSWNYFGSFINSFFDEAKKFSSSFE